MIIPLLENPQNRMGWPEMISEDISRQLYSLRGTVYRMWGQLRGQTLLPLPFGLEMLQKAERLALDTYVITALANFFLILNICISYIKNLIQF